MSTIALKAKPSLSSLEFAVTAFKNRKDPYTSFIKLPQRFPEMVSAKIKGRIFNLMMTSAMAQYVLQKNYLNYAKDEPYDVLRFFFGDGLLTNNNPTNWRQQRTLIQPAFHRESLKRISEVVTTSTNNLLQSWKQKEGTTINFTKEMAKLTIDIVSKSLFTTDVPEESIDLVWNAINHLNETAAIILHPVFSIPFKFPMPRYTKARQYSKQLDELVFGIIKKRREQTNPPHDLLQLLMDARYEDTGTGMTDQQLRDEIMIIFVAGHETTVNALSWIWYLVKQHAACEQKLKEESFPFAEMKSPIFDDLPRLQYGKMVMNEALRMYPPVASVGRKALQDDVIEGYPIRAGENVGINIAALHHHPAYWQNPFDFHPERFRNFELKGDNRFIFMPFGGGPRICIGNNFAMMEMQFINAMLSSRVEMDLVSKNVKPIPLLTLKPKNGILMHLKEVKAI